MKKHDCRIVIGLVRKKSKILLVRRKVKEGNLVWVFPGGKIEEGETEQEALERELMEETNIEAQHFQKIGERIHPETGVHICYWAAEHKRRRLRKEFLLSKAKWKSVKDVFDLITTNLYEPVKKYLKVIASNPEIVIFYYSGAIVFWHFLRRAWKNIIKFK